MADPSPGTDVSMPTVKSVQQASDVSMPTVEQAWSGLDQDARTMRLLEAARSKARAGFFQPSSKRLPILPLHFLDNHLPMPIPVSLLDYGEMVARSVHPWDKIYFEKLCANPKLADVRENGWPFFLNVCFQNKFSMETFSNAIKYFDMLLAKAEVLDLENDAENLMWAVTCLRVGLKMAEKTVVKNDQWAFHFPGVRGDQLDEYELKLAELLEWNFNSPSVFSFFYYLIRKMSLQFASEGTKPENNTEVAALRAILSTYQDTRFLRYSPHEIGASIVRVFWPTMPLDDNVIYCKTTKERVDACVDLVYCHALNQSFN